MLCSSLGAPWYLATPVALNIATAKGTLIDPPLQGLVLRAIELTQKAPECFTNDEQTEPVGNLARDECNQTVIGECPTHLPTDTIWCRPINAFSLFVGQMFTDVYQSMDVYLHLSFPRSPDEY